MSAKNESKDPTISQNLKKLEQLMEWFDQDDFEIESAIEKFDEANKVADQIKSQLAAVENKITVLKQQ